MTANSFTGSINTDGQYKTLSSATGFTFTNDKTYAMQVQNIAYLKISDAEFLFNNEKFYYTANSDGIYIKTNGYATITILEI